MRPVHSLKKLLHMWNGEDVGFIKTKYSASKPPIKLVALRVYSMCDMSIHSTNGHITAVLIFVPMEWLRLDFVIFPGVNGFQSSLTPIKAFVF